MSVRKMNQVKEVSFISLHWRSAAGWREREHTFGCTQSASRLVAQQLLHLVLDSELGHFAREDTGRDGVDGDVSTGERGGEVARQGVGGSL